MSMNVTLSASSVVLVVSTLNHPLGLLKPCRVTLSAATSRPPRFTVAPEAGLNVIAGAGLLSAGRSWPAYVPAATCTVSPGEATLYARVNDLHGAACVQ